MNNGELILYTALDGQTRINLRALDGTSCAFAPGDTVPPMGHPTPCWPDQLARLPDNHRQLHWAQAKVYAWLMCEQLGKTHMSVALVYFDITHQTETVMVEQHSAADLEQFFESLCQRFVVWADQETAHRVQRAAALITCRWR